jgi:hypothetical protein
MGLVLSAQGAFTMFVHKNLCPQFCQLLFFLTFTFFGIQTIFLAFYLSFLGPTASAVSILWTKTISFHLITVLVTGAFQTCCFLELSSI